MKFLKRYLFPDFVFHIGFWTLVFGIWTMINSVGLMIFFLGLYLMMVAIIYSPY